MVGVDQLVSFPDYHTPGAKKGCSVNLVDLHGPESDRHLQCELAN